MAGRDSVSHYFCQVEKMETALESVAESPPSDSDSLDEPKLSSLVHFDAEDNYWTEHSVLYPIFRMRD